MNSGKKSNSGKRPSSKRRAARATPKLTISRGRALPIGASPDPGGVNFALLCRHGTRVWLVLSPADSNDPFAEIELDSGIHRTGANWHVRISGLPDSFRYGWRVDGPQGPEHRFDSRNVLLDPACTTVAGSGRWGELCETDSHISSHRSLYRGGPRYDWSQDVPPRTPPEDSVIYELHVRGFTCDSSSGVKNPGTFAGLSEKLDYLKWLGITAVELLPIHEFDECDCPFINPMTGEKNRNFWGYNSIAFAAAKASYAAGGIKNDQLREFRDLVKEFHAAGLEVVLDVVFNHTAEGDDRGRTYSFRGLDNQLYYLLREDGSYLNFTGCGNTLNCNHPVVRDMLLNCLRYWVDRVHVDGFRFDLASILSRDTKGHLLLEPPVIESIVEDGVLADSKLIAEPWDAVGVYQVGTFPYGQRWGEWNGKFRDDVRRFWRGDRGMVSTLATRICGSPDLYQASGRLPVHSINFITCHDGFTLNDLVSYATKHNQANGENNRDGTPENFSWNCGVEGLTDDPAVLALRERQARNLMATLLLSQGVPMILAGDEMLRTQQGNNNAWCQDNEISWLDWSLARKHAGFQRFVREMIAFRMRHPALRRRQFFRGKTQEAAGLRADISWHGIEPNAADFGPLSHAIAFMLDGTQTGREHDADIFVILNAWKEPLSFRLPPAPNGERWRRAVDTSQPSPHDIAAEKKAPLVASGAYEVADHSVVVLIAR
ncbi:MAG: glycogen debranching protein GlgX [Gemmataceae bacterium]